MNDSDWRVRLASSARRDIKPLDPRDPQEHVVVIRAKLVEAARLAAGDLLTGDLDSDHD